MGLDAVFRLILRMADLGPSPLTTINKENGECCHRWPEVLPGGSAVIFTIMTGTSEYDTRIALHEFDAGARRVLIEHGANPRYAPTGHLVFVRDGTLMAVPFDLDHLTVTGSAVPVISDVMQSLFIYDDSRNTSAAQFSFSNSGILIYAPGGTYPDRRTSLVLCDDVGTTKPLPLEIGPYFWPRMSPDGKRLVYATHGRSRTGWVFDFEQDTAAE